MNYETEAGFQAAVREYAEGLGWTVENATWNSKNSPAGFPDLTLSRERILFLECKKENGTISKAQQECHQRMRSAGAELYVIWPNDFPSLPPNGLVGDILRSQGRWDEKERLLESEVGRTHTERLSGGGLH